MKVRRSLRKTTGRETAMCWATRLFIREGGGRVLPPGDAVEHGAQLPLREGHDVPAVPLLEPTPPGRLPESDRQPAEDPADDRGRRRVATPFGNTGEAPSPPGAVSCRVVSPGAHRRA